MDLDYFYTFLITLFIFQLTKTMSMKDNIEDTGIMSEEEDVWYDGYKRGVNGQKHYPRDTDGNEFYLTQLPLHRIYIFDRRLRRQRYAKFKDKSEFYARVNFEPLFIYDKAGKVYYAKTFDGSEFYPTDLYVGGEKIVFTEDNKPIYAVNANGRQIYPKDKYGNDALLGEPTYAKTEEGNEYYPRKYNSRENIVALDEEYKPIYAVTRNGRQIYPRNGDGHETWLGASYAKDEKGEFYYPRRNADRDQYMVEGKQIFIGDKLKYPLRSNGKAIYPINASDAEEYVMISSIPQIAVNVNGDGQYARKANGDEYYPNIYLTAYTHDGVPMYAVDNDNNVIFQNNLEGGERFIQHDNEDDVMHYYTKDENEYLQLIKLPLDRYPITSNGMEVYPRQPLFSMAPRREMILNNQYAKDKNKIPYYPLDEFLNEYTIKWYETFTQKDVLPIGYPITNDGLIILAEVNGEPYIPFTIQPQIYETDIIGLLYRGSEGYVDYLTNVKSPRPSRGQRRLYSYKPYVKDTSSNIPIVVTSNGERKIIRVATEKPPLQPSYKSKKTMMVFILILIFVFILSGFLTWNYFIKH